MRYLRLALCLPTLLFASAQSLAAPGDTIGSAVMVVSLVTAQLEDDQRRLANGDDVRQQELIEVDADGRSELVLRDDTKLALGPGSRLLLDQFVYNPDISGGAIVLDLVRGTFRFITGIAAKPAYVIRTPTASITVRGTIFDVYVQTSGLAWLLLIEGAIEVCTDDGKCRVHDEPGKLIRIGTEKIDKPVKWASLADKEDTSFESAFPFVATAPGFDPDPIFTQDDIVLGTFPDKPGQRGDPQTKPDKKDGGKKANDGKRQKKKAKKHRKKPRKVRRKRRQKSKAADVQKIIKGLDITIGIGGGLGRKPGRSSGGGGKKPGGGYQRFSR